MARFFRNHIIFILLLTAWTGLHIYNLDQEYLWYDELCSVLSANGRRIEMSQFIHAREPVVTSRQELFGFLDPPQKLLGDFFRQQARSDLHPPLFFLLLRVWMWAGASSVPALVILPLLICLASFILMYQTALRSVERHYHLLVPGVWMFTITGYYIGTELRQYCLLLFLSAAVTEAGRRARLDPELFKKPAFIAVFGVCLGLGILTQYMFAFLVMGVDLWLLAYLVRNNRKRVAGLVIANVIGALITLGWVPSMLKQLGYHGHRFFPELGLLEIWHRAAEIFLHFFIAPESVVHVSLIPIALFIVLGLYRPPFPGFRTMFSAIVGCCFILPMALISFRLIKISQIFDVRYFVTVVPVLYLAFANGAAAFPYRRAGILLLSVLLLMIGLNHLASPPEGKRGRKRAQETSAVSFRGMVDLMEKRHGRDFAVAFNFQNLHSVEAARLLSPDTMVIIGKCPELAPFLEKWSQKHRPAGILYSHIKVAPRLRRRDCTGQVIKRLCPLYKKEGKTLSNPRWSYTMFSQSPAQRMPNE